MKYLLSEWRPGSLITWLCSAMYTQNKRGKWKKSSILAFPKKGDLEIAKKYTGITITSIDAKVYNALLLNCIRSEVLKNLRKKKNGFRRNWSTSSLIQTLHRILDGVLAKYLETKLSFVEQMLLEHGLPKETATTVIMLFKNTKAMARSPEMTPTSLILSLESYEGTH